MPVCRASQAGGFGPVVVPLWRAKERGGYRRASRRHSAPVSPPHTGAATQTRAEARRRRRHVDGPLGSGGVCLARSAAGLLGASTGTPGVAFLRELLGRAGLLGRFGGGDGEAFGLEGGDARPGVGELLTGDDDLAPARRARPRTQGFGRPVLGAGAAGRAGGGPRPARTGPARVAGGRCRRRRGGRRAPGGSVLPGCRRRRRTLST